ncbi:glycerate kinase type-2 family protein [Chitinophaga cymbidii]|uniref:Hydroxypyruvate reductase n=1 Tax=Chitinophaga cymbidii TaxID=1096750 RepID=A0A512REN2_9BACT|nr:DUF4147 domain-containing protein [Chitinophaga cymbidii]GEP94165.1 hydroxypyruvate reductase [Chitinophaga cymbidii]
MERYTRQAIDIFRHAVAAAQPRQFMRTCFEPGLIPPQARILVAGAGKASAAMAQAAEEIWGEQITGGMVITNRQEPLPLQKVRQVQAAHPVPDNDSLLATDMLQDMIAGAKQSGEETIILFLLSGGASSLMADVPPGSSLTEVRQLFDDLLKSGADIREMNTVRKHLSRVKGGQLARSAYPTRIFSVILSDVPGNDPAVIGSGPTVPDPTTFADAWDILEKYRLVATLPPGLRKHLEQGLAGSIPDTPKPGDHAFAHSRYTVAASNHLALEAARQHAEKLGYHAQILTDTATGEARTLGMSLAKHAMDYYGPYPACLLVGGESTVVVKGGGLGGRNQELALAAGIALKDTPHITFLSAGTDGIDGPTDAAGAVVNARIMQSAPDPLPYMEQNDSYHFFEKTGTHIKTGPTQTNVMDIMVILIQEPVS